MEVAMVEAVLNRVLNRVMDGYSEADEYDNSKTWRQMRSSQKK